jgi:drug/metabolite transporter (DMT)-like permease
VNVPAVLTALAAAVLFGWSTALMHAGASGVPSDVRNLLDLVRQCLVQWRWLLGMAASLSGLVLHVVALGLGSILVVQPLVVTGLVFSFIFRAALDRRLISRPVLLRVLLTAVGLAVFLVTLGNTTQRHPSDTTAVVVLLAVGVACAAGTYALASRREPRRSGVLLGVSGGIVFGLIAGVLKAATVNHDEGVALLANWAVYAVIPLGVSGFLINQRAYHAAPLTTSLPVLNLLNPVVALLFGVVAFAERPQASFVADVLGSVGLVAVLVGIVQLARIPDDPDAPPEPRGTGRTPLAVRG